MCADIARLPIGAAVIYTSPHAPSADTRTLSYAVTGGSTDASDYTLALTGTLQFAPGQMRQLLPIQIQPDALDEGSETLTLQLSADPASIALQQSTFTLTIRDSGACQAYAALVVRP